MSVHPRPSRPLRARPSTLLRRFHRHAVEKRVEGMRLDLDAGLARDERLRQSERAGVETFVELTHPRAVEEQNLQRVTAPPEEDEERTGTSLATDLGLGQSGEPVEAPYPLDEPVCPSAASDATLGAWQTRRSGSGEWWSGGRAA